MKLPNASNAIISPEKLRDYLLSPTHAIGRYKATFFRGLGYSQGDWQTLAEQLRGMLGGDAIDAESNEYGRKFLVRGTLTGLNGQSADIVTVWIVLAETDTPRFVTAYPED